MINIFRVKIIKHKKENYLSMIAEKIDDINLRFINILSPIRNNILEDGKFYKLFYSNVNYISNGIYVVIPLLNEMNEYDNMKDSYILNKINDIEKYILSNIKGNKTSNFKLYTYFEDILKKKDFSKINPSFFYNSNNVILKISGVWENYDSIGLSYKLLKINDIISFS